MSNEEEPNITKPQKQTAELKDILNEMDSDGVPQFKNSNIGVVSTPSFLEEKISLPPQTQDPLPSPSSKEIFDEPTGNFFQDTGIFFKQLGKAYESRYNLWEKSDLTIMAILREMRRINEVNTEIFLQTINAFDASLTKGLNQFIIKRDEIEKFSDTDYKLIAKQFQKTLNLLNLQIREFKLHQIINELFAIYSK